LRATGLVGSWLALEIAFPGHAVRVLVPTGSFDNLEDIPADRVIADVADANSVQRATSSCGP